MEDTNQLIREARTACDEFKQLQTGHGIEECQRSKGKCLNALNKAIEELQDLKSGFQVMQDGSDVQDRAIQEVEDKLKAIYAEKDEVEAWKCDSHK